MKPLSPPQALRQGRVFVVGQGLATTSGDAPAKAVMRLKRTTLRSAGVPFTSRKR